MLRTEIQLVEVVKTEKYGCLQQAPEQQEWQLTIHSSGRATRATEFRRYAPQP